MMKTKITNHSSVKSVLIDGQDQFNNQVVELLIDVINSILELSIYKNKIETLSKLKDKIIESKNIR